VTRDGLQAGLDAVNTVHTLLDQLGVRSVGASSFEGDLTAVPHGRAFGGQVLGQAVMSGARTAPGHVFPTSLHAYFVSAAASGQPASYEVEVTRDGARFAWRRVTAKQRDRIVVDALMCFQRSAPASRSAALPEHLVDPEDLDSATAMAAAAGPELDWFFRRHGDLALEARYPLAPPPIRVAQGDWTLAQDVWLRAELPPKMSWAARGAVLAFMSDVSLVATPLVALGRTGRAVDTSGATFDHQMQFHSAEHAVDGWLFFEQSADFVLDGVISASGQILARDGSVLVTVRQHGLALGGSQ